MEHKRLYFAALVCAMAMSVSANGLTWNSTVLNQFQAFSHMI